MADESLDSEPVSSPPNHPLTLADRLHLAQAVARLIRARLPLEQALSQLAQQSTGSLSQSTQAVSEKLQAGHSLARSLANGDDADTRMLAASIELGESCGELDTAIEQWVDYHLFRQRHRRRLRSALVYPVLLVAIALLSILYSAWRLIPQYQEAFVQLTDSRPKWFDMLQLIHRSLGFVSVVIVVMLCLMLWRCLARQYKVDRWGAPRNRALRHLHYGHVAKMSDLGLKTGRPVSEWLGLVMASAALPSEGESQTLTVNEPWSRRLGNETSGVLNGLAAGQLSVTDATSLLSAIGAHAAAQAEWEIDREVQRLPIVTSLCVGLAAMVTYAGLIYLPWLALFHQIVAGANDH